MNLRTQKQMTVLFRGDIRDTAILVGLVQARVPIGIIAYTGPLEKGKLDYLKSVNNWLESKNQPLVLIHPYLTHRQLENILSCPLQEWGWSQEECKAAIKMAGLPLPDSNYNKLEPNLKQTKET